MARRSPARYLAPLALVAFAVALVMVVSRASDPGEAERTVAPAPAGTATPGNDSRKGRARKRHKRTYTVKAGDTPSGIAERTGVPLAQLLELNPDLDPQSLTVGEKIRLRR
jgi:LysM repeat protein